MSVTSGLDSFQRRHPGAGYPIAVLYKYLDDSGGNLAALIAYYGFLSLFPLLLLASTILGIVLSGDPAAQQAVLSSALSQFPVIGQQLQQPSRIGGGLVGLLVGGLGALYGGLGVALAAQAGLPKIRGTRRCSFQRSCWSRSCRPAERQIPVGTRLGVSRSTGVVDRD